MTEPEYLKAAAILILSCVMGCYLIAYLFGA